MSYTPWSVVAFEQPTAAKWNILGENDESFNDGTGIDTLQASVVSQTHWGEELARVSSHGSSATMTTPSFTARKYLELRATFTPSTSSVVGLRFNGDSGATQYGWNLTSNDPPLVTNAGDDMLRVVPTTTNVDFVLTASILNAAAQRKTLVQANASTAATATHTSTFRRGTGRWNNASNQITTITLLVSAGVLNNAELIVMGHD